MIQHFACEVEDTDALLKAKAEVTLSLRFRFDDLEVGAGAAAAGMGLAWLPHCLYEPKVTSVPGAEMRIVGLERHEVSINSRPCLEATSVNRSAGGRPERSQSHRPELVPPPRETAEPR